MCSISTPAAFTNEIASEIILETCDPATPKWRAIASTGMVRWVGYFYLLTEDRSIGGMDELKKSK